jgi:hypothetical protein
VAPLGGPDHHHGRVARLKRIISSNGFRLGLALAVSALTLYLALRQVDLAQVRQVLAGTDWRYAALGVLSGMLGIGLKIGRWMLLMRAAEPAAPREVPAGWQPATTSFLSAQLINNFFPLRVGELGRVAVMGRTGTGYAFVAGTIAIEKALDLAAFALLFVLLLVILPSASWLGAPAYWLAGLGFLVMLVALLAASQQERLAGWQPGSQTGSVKDRLLSQLRLSLTSLRALRQPLHLAGLALLTALIWALALWTNQLAFQALGLELPLSAALLVLIILQVGVSLPSLPGRVGVFEYACILALQSFGIDPAIALSYGILLHIVVYIPVIAGGLPALWLLPAGKPAMPGENR